MEEYSPADIPATIKLKEEIKPLQEEYKVAFKTGKHPDEKKYFTKEIGYLTYWDKCELIYINKLRALSLEIIDEHKNSAFKHINLREYPRFQELINDALRKNYLFLEAD